MSTLTWEHAAVIADVLVAIGTIVLAGFTWWMARQTRNEVRTSNSLVKSAEEQITATNRQASIAEQAMLASIQPLIADVPYSYAMEMDDPGYIRYYITKFNDTPSSVHISVPFRNIGHGPARIVETRLTSPKGLNEVSSTVGGRVIPVDGHDFATLRLEGSAMGHINLDPESGDHVFTLEVVYTNAYGTSPMISALAIIRSRSGDFQNYSVDHVAICSKR